jgi:hypothetical protein
MHTPPRHARTHARTEGARVPPPRPTNPDPDPDPARLDPAFGPELCPAKSSTGVSLNLHLNTTSVPVRLRM